MKPNSGAREFWIELTEMIPMIGDENGEMVPNGPNYFDVACGARFNYVSDYEIPNSIHVIEKSSFDELKKELGEKDAKIKEQAAKINTLEKQIMNPCVMD